jgi:serine/threonine protein kinase
MYGRWLIRYSWHADIKPDNILIVQGKFKLADPGFVKFVKSTGGTPRELLPGGTESYGRCSTNS